MIFLKIKRCLAVRSVWWTFQLCTIVSSEWRILAHIDYIAACIAVYRLHDAVIYQRHDKTSLYSVVIAPQERQAPEGHMVSL